MVKMKQLLEKAQSSYDAPFKAMLARVDEGECKLLCSYIYICAILVLVCAVRYTVKLLESYIHIYFQLLKRQDLSTCI